MKMSIVKRHVILSVLTLYIILVLTTVPAMATEFEFGTQFGISRVAVDNDFDESLTIAQIPSALAYLGSSPTSFYTTWFPNKNFGIGPEFSFGLISGSGDSTASFHLGGRTAYFLSSHSVSSPYFLGRISHTTVEDAITLTGIGLGVGYQWRNRSAFVFRIEARYQQLFAWDDEDDAKEFSLTIGIGTRFRNNDTQHP